MADCVRRAWLVLGSLTLPLEDEDGGWYCTQLDLGYPDVREVTESNPDRDGVDDSQTRLWGGRIISADITATKESVDAAAAQFAPFMNPAVRPQLHYVLDRPDAPERYFTVRAKNYTWPVSGSRTRAIQLQWLASDPLARSGDEQMAVAMSGPSSGTGRSYDLTFNRSYPTGSITPTTGWITSAGDAPFAPRYRIYGPITAPLLKIAAGATTVMQLQFAPGFVIPSNGYVDCDSERRTITDQAGVSQYGQVLWATSNWVALTPPTTYGMTLSGGTTSVVTQAQATWHDRFID